MNVLEVCQAVCYESNVPAPSSVFGSTDPGTLQLLHLYYATGRELRQAKCWPQLKRTHTITALAADTSYALPTDFYCATLDTFWDRSNQWKVHGPLSDSQYNEILYGYVAYENHKYYRIFGRVGEEQMQIQPPPAAGETLSFDYVSKNWIRDASVADTWVEAITADADYSAFDDDLMILGVKWRLYQHKGWAWEPLQAEYNSRIKKAQTRWTGSKKTTLYPTLTSNMNLNVPDGGYA
jgi:hypothetical protein